MILKVLITFILTLNLTLAPVRAQADDKQTENSQQHSQPITPIPEIYRAESGQQEVKEPNGESHSLFVDATSYTVNSEDELEEFSKNAEDCLGQAEQEKGSATPQLFLEEDGHVKQVSRSKFVRALRSIGSSISSDVKQDKMLPVFTVLRGAIYNVTITALLLANKIPHNAAIIGGATTAIMSAGLMIFNGPYNRWILKNPRTDVLFAKGLATQFPYVLIFESVMVAIGSPLHHGAAAVLRASFLAALAANAAQLPVSADLGIIAGEMTAKEESGLNRQARKNLIVMGRNFGALAMSGYSALAMSMQLLGIHDLPLFHNITISLSNVMYAAAGIPAWIYLGNKQNWGSKAKFQLQMTQEKISLVSTAITAKIIREFDSAIQRVGSKGPEGVPNEMKEAAALNDKELNRAECRGNIDTL